MTHPLRFKAPYAPKVGEWWELKGTTSGARQVREIYDTARYNATGQKIIGKRTSRSDYWKSLILEDCVRRSFINGQCERDIAPAIPPVEGARMLLRDGRITGPDITGLLWDDQGRSFIPEKGGIFTPSTDFIAVHTWPEEVGE